MVIPGAAGVLSYDGLAPVGKRHLKFFLCPITLPASIPRLTLLLPEGPTTHSKAEPCGFAHRRKDLQAQTFVCACGCTCTFI
ncbi:hypothetical protein FKM82_024403 [Ascaphus truei]